MTDFAPPAVPAARLERDGWTRTDEATEEIAALALFRVEGATVVYERDGAAFFFATRLRFVPPPVASVVAAAALPTVSSAARRSLTDRLRERGLDDVAFGPRERFDGATGATGSRFAFRARDGETPVIGALAVWPAGVEYRLAGGAYPEGETAAGETVADALAAVE